MADPCKNPQCIETAARGQKYCSRKCAPCGQYGDVKPIFSEVMEKFGTKAIGVELQQFSENEKQEPNEIERFMPTSQDEKNDASKFSHGEPEMPSTVNHKSEVSGAASLGEGKPTQLAKIENGEMLPTQVETYAEQLMNLEEAKLASTSFVDDAITRLHWQMRALAPQSTQVVNLTLKEQIHKGRLACQTAKTMAQMVKLKLDAYKIFKEVKTR